MSSMKAHMAINASFTISSPTKDGAVPAVKDAGFLLLLMADKGAVAAVKKVFAPLKMVLLLLLR